MKVATALELQTFEEGSIECRSRIGPLWRKCDNFLCAKDAWKFVKPMMAIVEKYEAMGIAANQVGLDIPLFILRVDGQLQPCYRPRILSHDDSWQEGVEECLSFPGVKRGKFRRKTIKVDFIAFPNNKRKQMVLRGLEARAFQHEYDHLQGKTILDWM